MSVIKATRTCFNDAAEMLIAMVGGADPEPVHNGEVVIVHGIIESNEPGQEGKLISHGWIEYKEFVFFRGVLDGETLDLRALRREFYKACKVKELIRYPCWEVAELSQRCGHTGPWIEAYQQLANRVTA
jgi:hypothetical protein